MGVLIGGVGELFQGDLDLGRHAVQRLLHEHHASSARRGRAVAPACEVLVEELHYGAVAVAQRLEELRPGTLILVGAVRRGRPAGSVRRRRIEAPSLTPDEVQAAVGDAVTGYVGMDLLVEVAAGFGVLPARTVTFEVEPETVTPGDGLSAPASRGLETVLELVHQELGRLPVLDLAVQLRGADRAAPDGTPLAESSADAAMDALLDALQVLERDGRWGSVFARRDQLRLAIAQGQAGTRMDHREWGQWWAMLEELDRLQGCEAAGVPVGRRQRRSGDGR
jgi:hypothetical protein